MNGRVRCCVYVSTCLHTFPHGTAHETAHRPVKSMPMPRPSPPPCGLDAASRTNAPRSTGAVHDREDGRLVRTTYGSPHPSAGKSCFYGHGGDLVRVEFGTPHRNAGMITFYENGEHVRTEYTDGREVAHFEGGMLLRVVRNAGAGAGRNPDDPEGESRYVHPHRIVGSPAGAPADHAGAGGAGAPQHSGDAVLLYESGKLARIEYGNGNETAGISETTEPSGPAGAICVLAVRCGLWFVVFDFLLLI